MGNMSVYGCHVRSWKQTKNLLKNPTAGEPLKMGAFFPLEVWKIFGRGDSQLLEMAWVVPPPRMPVTTRMTLHF